MTQQPSFLENELSRILDLTFNTEATISVKRSAQEFMDYYEEQIPVQQAQNVPFPHLSAFIIASLIPAPEGVTTAHRALLSGEKPKISPNQLIWLEARIITSEIDSLMEAAPNAADAMSLMEQVLSFTSKLNLIQKLSLSSQSSELLTDLYKQEKSVASKTPNYAKDEEKQRVIRTYEWLWEQDASIDNSQKKRVDAVIDQGNFSLSRRVIGETIAKKYPLRKGRKKKEGSSG